MLKNVVFRVLEFPGKKICKKTRSMRVVSAFGMISLSLSLSKTLSSQTHHHHHHHHPPSNTTTTTTHRKKVLSRKKKKKKKKKKRERALRFPSCGGLFLSSSCFVLWPVLLLRIQFVFGETD